MTLRVAQTWWSNASARIDLLMPGPYHRGATIRSRLGGRRLGLHDPECVPARVDDPGRPGVAHVRDAVDRDGVGRRVLLDTDAAGAQLGDRRVDIRDPPGELRLGVGGARRALGHD